MLESIRVLEIIQEPIFSALTSQYGSMSRVAAQSSNSAFLLPKLGSMANAYDLLGPRASFKLFKSQKFEQLGGIMKTIGKIALLAVTLFAFGATVQAQDVGQKNTTGRVIADKIIMYIPNRIVDFFDIFSLE